MVRDLTGKHPEYYEATLQLREVTQDLLDYVDASSLIIQKIVKVKNGYDYFLADNNQARAMGKKLQDKFGGKVVMTSSLHTKKDNKELYRVTVLFRQSGFKKGDEVMFHDEPYVVRAMARDIYLQHSKTGKKVHVRFTEMKKIKKMSKNN